MGRHIDDAGQAIYTGTKRGCIVLIYALLGIGGLALVLYLVLRAAGN